MMGIHNNKKVQLTIGVLVVVAITQFVGVFSGAAPGLTQVNDDNWNSILEGEWMVEFFAPWCPACRNLQPVWEDFASWSNDLGIKVGQVDITSSPGLSGRFMITALPTIFHVKDGQFRQYKGPRSKEEFLGFVEEKRWEALEPVSSWQSPSSFQMTLVSQFYKISMSLRNVMNIMLEEYGIPTWAAYLTFGVATIIIGLILGLVLVCVIDFIYPPGPAPPSSPRPAQQGEKKEKDSDDDDFTEEIQDEDSQSQSQDSQDEEVEDSAAQDDEPEKEEEPEKVGDVPTTPKTGARRRRRD